MSFRDIRSDRSRPAHIQQTPMSSAASATAPSASPKSKEASTARAPFLQDSVVQATEDGTSSVSAQVVTEQGISIRKQRNAKKSRDNHLKTLASQSLSRTKKIANFRQGPPVSQVSKVSTPHANILEEGTNTFSLPVDKSFDISQFELDLDISHPRKSDLIVQLSSPSGNSYLLHNGEGGFEDDLHETFDLSDKLAGEPALGEWKVTIQDVARGDKGTLRSWSLRAKGSPVSQEPPASLVSKVSTPHAKILEDDANTFSLPVDKCFDVSQFQLDLDIAHPRKSDLIVQLSSPSGNSYLIHNREGGFEDDLRESFDLSDKLAGEPAQGEWKLIIQDMARGDKGTLRSWGFQASSTPPPEEQE